MVRTKELNGQFAVTHGMAGTKQSRRATVYSVWHKMKQRCLNPNDTRFKDYGGRGITCCPEWIRFEAFYRDMGDPPLGHQLDRIDNDKGYSPENCRWVDRSTQQNNRRTNVVITVDGESLTATEWSRRLGLKPITILMRIKRGWNPVDSLRPPTKKHRPHG